VCFVFTGALRFTHPDENPPRDAYRNPPCCSVCHGCEVVCACETNRLRHPYSQSRGCNMAAVKGRIARMSMALAPVAPAQPRVRKRTPPRITEHKPPLPKEPHPAHAATTSDAGPSPAPSPAAGLSIASVGGPPRASVAEPMRGYMNKKGEIAIAFRSPWKRRWFVLENSEMTYYTSQESWQRGEKPLKGHKIDMREMVLMKDTDDGSDIALAHVDSDAAKPAVAGAKAGSGAAASGERVWQFVCESKAELDAWMRALVLHGARPRQKAPASSSPGFGGSSKLSR